MDFYRKAGRESLPWRKEGITAYEVWVSEIMLQQTQVSRVIDYYAEFLKRFPDVFALSQATWEEFLPYYAGLGYYRRGQNMLLTAKKVMDAFDGEFPRDKKLLMMLPGVGDYTASAILSFAYGDNHLAWDTNLKRVIGRFFYGSKEFDKGCHAELVCPDTAWVSASRKGRAGFTKDGILKQVQDDKTTQVQRDNVAQVMDDNALLFKTPAKDLNAALMDFGSAICVGRPKCKICPLAKQCVYFSEEGIREIRKSMENEDGTVKDGILRFAQDDKEKKDGSEKIYWKDAQVYLWLHKDHKLYYSSHPKKFEVFALPPRYNSRAGIKAYFRDTYALDVAVRPPHAKIIVHGKPTLLVNAQILLGEPCFATFSKDDVKAYNDGMTKD